MKNKNGLGNMMKEAGILFAITLLAGLALGFVYQLTKEPIRIQKERKIQEACQEVFQDAVSFEALNVTPDEQMRETFAGEGISVGNVFGAYDGNNGLLGYVVEMISTEGYGGKIGLYMGIRNGGILNGVAILEISETPGLGMEAESVLIPQFAGKQESTFTYTKTGAENDSQIDAISGATITTKAVVSAVNAGLTFYGEMLQEGGVSHE